MAIIQLYKKVLDKSGPEQYHIFNDLKTIIPFLNQFNFARFYTLTPFTWFLILSFSIVYYLNYKIDKYGVLIYISIIFASVDIFIQSDFIQEYKFNKITFAEFYSEKLFSKIYSYINLPQEAYKVVCIGMHPAIARYNGFYTIDGYLPLYPMEYKIKFRRIIDKELKRNMYIKEYYDGWGSRVYIFSSEIGKNFLMTKEKSKKITIFLNTYQILKMGGRFIFSTCEIKNAKQNNLKLIKIFEESSSPWKIYLYKIIQ